MLFLICLLIVGWMVFTKVKYQRDWEAACAEADQLDPGWRTNQRFQDWVKKPIDPQLLEFWNAFPQGWMGMANDDWTERVPPIVTSWEMRLNPNLMIPEDWRKMFFPRMEDARLVKVRELAKKLLAAEITGRIYLSSTDDPVQPIQRYRNIANYFHDEVEWQLAQGNGEDGLLECLIMLKFARQCFGIGHLLTDLTAFALHAHALYKVERCLAMGQYSDAVLLQVQNSIDPVPDFDQFISSLRVTINKELSEAKYIFWNTGKQWFDSKEWPGLGKVEGKVREYWESTKLPNYRLQHLQFINEAQKRWRSHQDIIDLRDWAESQLQNHPMNASLKLSDAYRSTIALSRCTQAAIASERFRMKHNRWPKELKELVPEFLPGVPQDTYVRGDLKLLIRPDGITIYTVYMNKIDDNGNIAANTDKGIRLYSQEHRRIPFEKANPNRQR